ncbi:MAG: hypothetical protein JF623_06700 [Acidobacteria bacterium]|nr:hypothetical protein [Acidobacteriota bacterium]
MGRTDGYAPIEDYAAIGNGETVALVARDGSIDWLPLPRLDSQTVFARILDPERGGAFELAPEGAFEVERRYRGDSNVLETTFTTTGGVVRVTDAITLDNGGLLPWFELARRVEGVSGRVPMRWRIAPRLGAGEDEEEVTIIRVRDAVVAKTRERYLAVQAFDAGDLNHTTNTIGGAFETHEASRALLVLRSAHDEPIPFPRRDWVERRVDGTADDWQRWLADAGVDGEWRDATRRSALVLRLLTYVPSGGVAAAATTSLPEAIGGDRNYDYRYGWVRCAAATRPRASGSSDRMATCSRRPSCTCATATRSTTRRERGSRPRSTTSCRSATTRTRESGSFRTSSTTHRRSWWRGRRSTARCAWSTAASCPTPTPTTGVTRDASCASSSNTSAGRTSGVRT